MGLVCHEDGVEKDLRSLEEDLVGVELPLRNLGDGLILMVVVRSGLWCALGFRIQDSGFRIQRMQAKYGSTGTVSRSGDVYSFGIMLLEIMARKKPTDEMFAGGVTLRQWVNVSIPDNVLEVVDADLLSIEEGRDMYATESMLMSILEIGLRCSEVAAEDRMDIKDVVPKLKKIKLALQE
ncbi:putative protein kinase RLK-Pelle-LRR-XII-1 family [Rosa chinensis]|uniref:Non-specific serine/threonine protein kinase n=1 Tax=Rosa chinensis TaxID=74649 RepID=A0A2P6QTV2_ROSCH|nr:putative protein kinase RLK-Pelle-LRR-XII-1 family [Rosa chinensis]